MKKQLLLAAVAVAAAAGAAHANNIQSYSVMANYGPDTPTDSQVLTFDKFDGTLGTLLSVKIKVSLAISGGFLALDNDGADPASGTAELGAVTTINGVGVPVIDNAFNNILGSGLVASNMQGFVLAGNDGDPVNNSFDAGGPDYFEFNGLPSNNMNMGFVNSGLIGAYNDADGIAGGLDTYGIDVTYTQVFDYQQLGGVAFSGLPVTVEGTVMIEYTYKAIPAPAAAGLLGLGALVAGRRRR
mgnify:FL=1|jgi:hypothetical protein